MAAAVKASARRPFDGRAGCVDIDFGADSVMSAMGRNGHPDLVRSRPGAAAQRLNQAIRDAKPARANGPAGQLFAA